MDNEMSLTDILEDIKPFRTEVAGAQKALREKIAQSRLYGELVEKVYISGSYARGTMIKGRSDVDLIFLLKEKPSGREGGMDMLIVLQKAASSLETSIQDTSLTLTWEDIDFDLVAAVDTDPPTKMGDAPIWVVFKRKKNCWVRTSPMWHKQKTKAIDEKYKGNFRRLVKLVKAWNVKRKNVKGEKFFRSFHLELLVREFIEVREPDSGLPELIKGFFLFLQHDDKWKQSKPDPAVPNDEKDVQKSIDRSEQDQVLKNL